MAVPIGIVAVIALLGGGFYKYKQRQSNLLEGGAIENKKMFKKVFKQTVKKNGKNLKENMVWAMFVKIL